MTEDGMDAGKTEGEKAREVNAGVSTADGTSSQEVQSVDDSLKEAAQPETSIGNPESQSTESQSAESQSEESQNTESQNTESEVPQNREASSDDVTSRQAEYTVREGDTLATVCRMYYGNLDMLQEICDVNGIVDPNTILPGQKLVLP